MNNLTPTKLRQNQADVKEIMDEIETMNLSSVQLTQLHNKLANKFPL